MRAYETSSKILFEKRLAEFVAGEKKRIQVTQSQLVLHQGMSWSQLVEWAKSKDSMDFGEDFFQHVVYQIISIGEGWGGAQNSVDRWIDLLEDVLRVEPFPRHFLKSLEELFQQTSQGFYTQVTAIVFLAFEQDRARELEKIIALVRKATEIPRLQFLHSWILFNLAEYRQALSIALKLQPKTVEVYILLGQLHEELGCYDRALSYHQRASQIDPGNLLAMFQAAKVSFSLGKTHLAWQYVSLALDKNSENLELHTLGLFILSEQSDRWYTQGVQSFWKALFPNRRVILREPQIGLTYLQLCQVWGTEEFWLELEPILVDDFLPRLEDVPLLSRISENLLQQGKAKASKVLVDVCLRICRESQQTTLESV
ncbi:MAG: hypothetical protein OXT67_03380 [Zetaproteobacteria bacterium]|nr:hypothetical protein [Zetaproteobacteria bacterium]